MSLRLKGTYLTHCLWHLLANEGQGLATACEIVHLARGTQCLRVGTFDPFLQRTP